MRTVVRQLFGTAMVTVLAASLAACGDKGGDPDKDRKNPDEAAVAGLAAAHFKHAGEDYFQAMDGGVALTPEEVKGRNMWLLWSGGNDRFWDGMSKPTLGAFDLLKIVAPPPGSKLRRETRWEWIGAVNEPCFRSSPTPDAQRFGLYFDVRDPSCPPDPFADEAKYPGVKLGARGANLPVGSYYGWPTGIVGLRLFPNPKFDAAAAQRWDPVRYYNDEAYWTDPKLVRPYRVGMACSFCHVGPSPTNPPADPNNPKWENLSSFVGAQYLWSDRLFFWKPREDNFVYQWVKTFRPGATDTSLVSTDNINNPRTQNAVYSLGDRLAIAKQIGRETLAGGGLANKQFNDFFKSGPLTEFFTGPDTVLTPHVLKDGADSVGALGALNRVHFNIGLYSEEWLTHFNPVMGGKPTTPISIAFAQKQSPYWQATEAGTPATALFFLKAALPHRLRDAPGGAAQVPAPTDPVYREGATVFANTCARCHSSKQPQRVPANVKLDIGANYLASFQNWWKWTQTEDYKSQMRGIVLAPNFLDGNYLSTDARVPVTLLRTNLCSPLATNGIRGNIWDNFSSDSYKRLTAVGNVTYRDPFTGQNVVYPMPGGGRGYTRPPSLISLWSTAPFLLNNTVGPFVVSPSVSGRLQSFNASIEQMLWPERRARDSELGGQGVGWIDRTDVRSYLYVPRTYLEVLPGLMGKGEHDLLRQLVDANGNLQLGPIPKGMPVNLLASLQPLAESSDHKVRIGHYRNVLRALVLLKRSLLRIKGRTLDDAQLRQAFAPLRTPLMQLNKCPDFVVNRGHYFGTQQFNETQGLTREEASWGQEPVLTDGQKRALIAFLKTF